MLVLRMYTGDRVAVDVPGYGRLWLVLLNVYGRQAQVGFDCPEEVRVYREKIAPPEPGARETKCES